MEESKAPQHHARHHATTTSLNGWGPSVGRGLLIFAVVGCMLYAGLPALKARTYATPPAEAPGPSEVSGTPRLSFVAVGDWGRNGNAPQRAAAQMLGEYARDVCSPFVVSVGDNFYSSGTESPTDLHFERSWTGVYTHTSLASLPWYLVLGNHDYRGTYLQVDYPGDDRWTLPNPFFMAVHDLRTGRERSGPRSGVPAAALRSSTASGGDTLCLAMVYVDTCPWIDSYRSASTQKGDPTMYANVMNATSTAEQLAWLEASLTSAAAACDAVVVVGHHPLYTPGEHGDNPAIITAWEPLFKKYGVDAYLAGHDHILAHLEKDDVQYVVTGAGSDTRNNSVVTPQTVFLRDATPGFTVHSTNATHMSHTYVTASGEVIFRRTAPLRQKLRAM